MTILTLICIFKQRLLLYFYPVFISITDIWISTLLIQVRIKFIAKFVLTHKESALVLEYLTKEERVGGEEIVFNALNK